MTTTSQPAHEHRRRRRPSTRRPAVHRRGKVKSGHRILSGRRPPHTQRKKAARPNVTDYEALFFPAWMDDDPASDGPNYLGYVATVLVVALLFEFAVLALVMTW